MGKLELGILSSNKNIQVEMKYKTNRTKQRNVDRHHTNRADNLQNKHDTEKGRRQVRTSTIYLYNINSAYSSLEEKYNRMLLKHEQSDAIAVRKHNSDISDFITIVDMEDNLGSMRDDAALSEGDDSRSLSSKSELNIISGTLHTCHGNKSMGYTELNLDIDDCTMGCTYNLVNNILRRDIKGWKERAYTSRKKCNSVKSSPWERANDIFSCDRACSIKQKSQRRKAPREPAQGPSYYCNDGSNVSLNREESERCDTLYSRDMESETGTVVERLSGARHGCSSNICTPCQLCQQGCASLKLTSSEERIALEWDMARCDCKRKLLKLRLMKAFNMCAKCRLPRSKCRCLEEIIRDYRRREMEKEIELKQKSHENGSDCICEDDDPFAKLIHEVTNTCPKCGHWRNECTCLEEMIIDVKRIMLKKKMQHGNSQEDGRGKSCKCVSKGKRGRIQDSTNQTTNVDKMDFPPPKENDSEMRTFKDQNKYNSSKTIINMQISNTSPPLQYSTSPQVQQNELEDMEALYDICSVCKKRTASCDCNVVSAFVKSNVLDSDSEHEQVRSNPQERNRMKRSTPEKVETTEGFYEETLDETGRVHMCEECLRPKLKCVRKHSPTCYKCGKEQCEDSERYARSQSKFRSERPRSRTRHRYAESVRTSTDMNTHERTRQLIESHNGSRHEINQASRKSPTKESRFLPVANKTKMVVERCSQSAFQKLKSHFIRSNNCGNKQGKKSNESEQIQCSHDSKADDKKKNDNGKAHKKGRRPNKDASPGAAKVPLSPKRSVVTKQRHLAREK